jgi:hypothetical protein
MCPGRKTHKEHFRDHGRYRLALVAPVILLGRVGRHQRVIVRNTGRAPNLPGAKVAEPSIQTECTSTSPLWTRRLRLPLSGSYFGFYRVLSGNTLFS